MKSAGLRRRSESLKEVPVGERSQRLTFMLVCMRLERRTLEFVASALS